MRAQDLESLLKQLKNLAPDSPYPSGTPVVVKSHHSLLMRFIDSLPHLLQCEDLFADPTYQSLTAACGDVGGFWHASGAMPMPMAVDTTTNDEPAVLPSIHDHPPLPSDGHSSLALSSNEPELVPPPPPPAQTLLVGEEFDADTRVTALSNYKDEQEQDQDEDVDSDAAGNNSKNITLMPPLPSLEDAEPFLYRSMLKLAAEPQYKEQTTPFLHITDEEVLPIYNGFDDGRDPRQFFVAFEQYMERVIGVGDGDEILRRLREMVCPQVQLCIDMSWRQGFEYERILNDVLLQFTSYRSHLTWENRVVAMLAQRKYQSLRHLIHDSYELYLTVTNPQLSIGVFLYRLKDEQNDKELVEKLTLLCTEFQGADLTWDFVSHSYYTL